MSALRKAGKVKPPKDPILIEIHAKLIQIIKRSGEVDFIFKLARCLFNQFRIDGVAVSLEDIVEESRISLNINPSNFIFDRWMENWKSLGLWRLTQIDEPTKLRFLLHCINGYIDERQLETQKWRNRVGTEFPGVERGEVETGFNITRENQTKLGVKGKIVASSMLQDYTLKNKGNHLATVYGPQDPEKVVFSDLFARVKAIHGQPENKTLGVCEVVIFKYRGNFEIKVSQINSERCPLKSIGIDFITDERHFRDIIIQTVYIYLKTLIMGETDIDSLLDQTEADGDTPKFCFHNIIHLYCNRTTKPFTPDNPDGRSGLLHTDKVSGYWYPDMLSLNYEDDGNAVKGAFLIGKECALDFIKSSGSTGPCKALMSSIPSGGSIIFRQNTYHATPMMLEEEIGRLQIWTNANLGLVKDMLMYELLGHHDESMISTLLRGRDAKYGKELVPPMTPEESEQIRGLITNIITLSQTPYHLTENFKELSKMVRLNDHHLELLLGPIFKEYPIKLKEKLRERYFHNKVMALISNLKNRQSPIESLRLEIDVHECEAGGIRLPTSSGQFINLFDLPVDMSGMEEAVGSSQTTVRTFFRHWITLLGLTNGLGRNRDNGCESNLSHDWVRDFIHSDTSKTFSDIMGGECQSAMAHINAQSRGKFKVFAREFFKTFINRESQPSWNQEQVKDFSASNWNEYVDKVNGDNENSNNNNNVRKKVRNKLNKSKRGGGLKSSNKDKNKKNKTKNKNNTKVKRKKNKSRISLSRKRNKK